MSRGRYATAVALTAWWLSGSPAGAQTASLTGTVTDSLGGVLPGARIVVLTPQRAVVATAATDGSGRYSVSGLRDGQYLIIAQFPGLAERQATVTIAGRSVTADLMLELAAHGQSVTVTASPGSLDTLATLSQPVNLISADDILERSKTVVAQAVEGEAGVQVQRTGPGMAGIFVRGLTGNKVNVFVDGVRYSNGAQRGGVNTFLDLIEPATLEGIEVLRGTSSAQYGSDALGGSIQFLTRVPPLSPTGSPKVSGTVAAGGETGHRGGMGTVSLAYSAARFGLSGIFSARSTGDYRPGGGNDSHAAVTRFFGIPSSRLYPERMPDTGFRQAGGQVRANWAPRSDVLVVANYLASRQDAANRWDQLLGGDGNLIAELNGLSLDLFYVRLESLKAGVFDHASITYSLNTQREERVNQGGSGNPAATISHEPERTTVHGLQFNAARQVSSRDSMVFGGELYLESFDSDAFNINAVTGTRSIRRPRVPDAAAYRQGGVFAQTTFRASDRLSVVGAVRVGVNRYEAHAADSPIVNGQPLWPDDSLRTASVTFRAGVAYTPAAGWTMSAALSRGYRAPHMTDLGTLGLTGSGFEVAAPDLAGRNAFIGSTADAAAVSTERPVAQVDAETNLNLDLGLRYQTSRVRISLGGFVNEITGNLQKQALILPPGAVGTSIGGQPITAQTAAGAVFVAPTTVPVLVRANFDGARLWGIEWSGDVTVAPDLTVGSTWSYLHAADLATGLPPNIEGGTPAPGGTVWARYLRKSTRWWVQPHLTFAAEQSRLSSLDLGDRRVGAARSRSSIENFFRNGARARGWVSPGPDAVFGNDDDTLIVTGETLAQIQDRVLGAGVSSSSLFTVVPGYVVLGVSVGLRLGAHTVVVDGENLTDENYRGISWGMDAPGRGISARYVYRF